MVGTCVIKGLVVEQLYISQLSKFLLLSLGNNF